MKRAFLICALSVLVAVPASVGAYFVAFADQPDYEEYPASPTAKLVCTIANPSTKSGMPHPASVHLARKAKSNLNETLVGNSGNVACRTGCSAEDVNTTIQQMNIHDWESSPLPENASVAQSFTMQMNGDAAMVTTYQYPNDEYVTVSSPEGNLTLCAPRSVGGDIARLAA